MADVRADLAARPQRNGLGQFINANVGSGKALTRSDAFWEAIAGVQAELVAKVTNDVAADTDGAATLLGLIDAYAEVRLMRESLWLTVVEQGGATTTKGRIRASYLAFMSAVATEERLAKTIGLSLRNRKLPTIQDYLAGNRDGAA